MILYKNRLIFGIIKTIFGAVFGVLYKLIALLNLQLTLLLLLIGAVLFLTGVFEQGQTFLTLYQVLLVISAVYAVISIIKQLLGIEKKVKRSKGAQIIDSQVQTEKLEQPLIAPTYTQIEPQQKPVYYRVKQNPEYVMAEYGDRYELFRVTDGQMKKIRTDYK